MKLPICGVRYKFCRDLRASSELVSAAGRARLREARTGSPRYTARKVIPVDAV